MKNTALLFWWMLAWLFYLAGWGIRHRGAVAQAGRATADAGRQMRGRAQKHPKRAASAGLVAGLVFCAGGIGGGAVIFGAVAAWCGFLLLKWRQAEKRTVLAAVAARADCEHHHLAAYGDVRGQYGQYPPAV
ncbi:hypothetical protein [Tomitella gaofuii]|uniref:hypothetical protein n=1 Tax=Tomitella gaofuii TaxID=2760083 RepID=UPI0015FDFEE2|nr:hypothetical protein [Tomitella gaofuii]